MGRMCGKGAATYSKSLHWTSACLNFLLETDGQVVQIKLSGFIVVKVVVNVVYELPGGTDSGAVEMHTKSRVMTGGMRTQNTVSYRVLQSAR